MIISFLFSLCDCYMGPIWVTRIWANPYGTHAEPGCTPHMGSPYGTHTGMFAGRLNILKQNCQQFIDQHKQNCQHVAAPEGGEQFIPPPPPPPEKS